MRAPGNIARHGASSVRGTKVRALAFAESLARGWVTSEHVVAWVDGIIEASDKADWNLIDASLSSHDVNQLISSLRSFGGEAEETHQSTVWALVLGDCHTWFRRNPSAGPRIASALYSMACQRQAPNRAAVDAMLMLDDEFELAVAGIHGTLADANADLREFLEQAALESVVD